MKQYHTSGSAEFPQLWHCNWDWCPKSFSDGLGLLSHLKESHFNNILVIPEKDWNAYLKSTEGVSGHTGAFNVHVSRSARSLPPLDSLHAAVRTDLPEEPNTDDKSELRADTSNELSRSSSHPRENSLPPPQVATTPREPATTRNSFQKVAADSSPMSTSSAQSLSPSPALSNRVANAVASHKNGLRSTASPTPLPLPRGPRKQPALSQHQGPLQKATGPGQSSSSESFSSSSSAQDVEMALTQNVEDSPRGSQDQLARPSSNGRFLGPGSASPEKIYPSLQTQAPYTFGSPSQTNAASSDSQTHPQSSSAPQSQASSQTLPLPRRRSSRSKTPAAAPAPAHTPLPLPRRPRSKTPAPAPLPLPRRPRSKTPASAPAPASRTLRSRSKTPSSSIPEKPAARIPLPRGKARARSKSRHVAKSESVEDSVEPASCACGSFLGLGCVC